MSARLVSLVLASGLPAYLRLPAVVMAHHAASDGSKVYPSVGRVARSCGLHKRRARAVLAELRELGVLKPVGLSRTGTVRYVFDAAALPPGEDPPSLPTPTEWGTFGATFPQLPQASTGEGGSRQPKPRSSVASDPPVIDQETLLEIPRGETTEEPDGERSARLELLEGIRGRLLKLELPRPAAGRRRRAR